MSRCTDCWDNALSEPISSRLNEDWAKKPTYKICDLAKADVFDYVEAFYNRIREHRYPGKFSSEVFERA